MSRTGLSALLILIAMILSACDKAADLIPGENQPTEEPTSASGAPTPITVPANVDSGSDTATPTPSIPDHELARSVVQIQAIDDSGGTPRVVRDGSGVIVDREAGLILTAYSIVRPHLSSGASAYTVIGIGVNDGNGGTPRLAYEADLVAIDDLLDLAVLHVTREYDGDALGSEEIAFPAAELGDSNAVEPGTVLRLFGHPGLDAASADSQALTVTDGTVTGRRGEPDHAGTTRLKLDVQLQYGTTGGPAFSRGGTLVGVLAPEHYDETAPVTQLRPLSVALPLINGARGLPTNITFVAPLHAEEPPAGFLAPIPGDGIWVSRPLFAENARVSGGSFDLYDYERGFVSGTQELFFEFAVQGAPDGAMVEERWFLNDVLQDSLSSSYAWEGGDFALVSDQIRVPAAALPNGFWRLEIWVNEALRAQSTAVVGVELQSPAMSNPSFGTLAGASGQSLTGLSAASEQILLFFDYANMEITGGIRWVVTRDGQVVYQSPEIAWPGGSEGRFWLGYADADGIGAGTWGFQVAVDGEQTIDATWDVF